MRSWWIESKGSRTEVEVRDVPVPQPAAGQVLVRMRAASLNRGELIASHGLRGRKRPRFRWFSWSCTTC